MKNGRVRDPADGRIGNLWLVDIEVEDVEREFVSVITEGIDDFSCSGCGLYKYTMQVPCSRRTPGGRCHVTQDPFLGCVGIGLAMNNQGQVHPGGKL